MESDGQKMRTNNGGGAGGDDDDDVLLPGFRFHPTDEELVGFYLRRKIEKKSLSIELIKQIDIYKYDPWDLPKASNVGDKEWYFFCKRGRKYRNSIRPNRVTGSGFWKATGIDRPIYSGGGEGRDCIGLKKSLVYYRGSAGKGTKTDWMMHEFRLPTDNEITTKHVHVKTTVAQEAGAAEVWTLCRILKRNVSYRKCMPEWKELSGGKRINKSIVMESSSSFDSTEEDRENYISFNSATAPVVMNMQSRPAAGNNYDIKPAFTGGNNVTTTTRYENFMSTSSSAETTRYSPLRSRLLPSFGDVTSSQPEKNMHKEGNIFQSSIEQQQQLDFFVKHADWDELRSLVEFGGVISPF